MKQLILYTAIMFAGMATIAANKSNAQTDSTQSIAGEWKLMPVLASDVATGKPATIQLNIHTHTFIGNTGCNSMKGKFDMHGFALSFSEQVIVTRNDCQGYNEQAFIANLTKVNRYKLEDGVLELMFDNTVLSKWIRVEAINGSRPI